MKLARPYRMTFYHGTGFKNLKPILRDGLQASSQGGAHAKAIYVTVDFDLAARYAEWGERHGSSSAIVLEIVLTSPRRFKKLKYDPMDRDDFTNESLSVEFNGIESDVLERVGQIVEEVFKGNQKIISKVIGTFRRYGEMFPNTIVEFDDFDGFPLYKYLIRKILDLSGKKNDRYYRNLLVQKIKKYLPPGEPLGLEHAFIEINEDGSLTLTDEYWSYVEQVQIFEERLPSKAIKGVWVKPENYKNLDESWILDERYVSSKALPQERDGVREEWYNLVLSLQRDLESARINFENEEYEEADADLYEAESAVKEALDLMDEYSGLRFDELVELLKKIKSMYERFQEEFDADEEEGSSIDKAFVDEFIDVLSRTEGVLEYAGDVWDSFELEVDSGTYVKLSIQNALKLQEK